MSITKSTAGKKVVTKKTSSPRVKKADQHNEPVRIPNALSIAKWFVENSTLTFDQISKATGLSFVDVSSIADGFIANNLPAVDPITKGYFIKDEIEECQKDSEKYPIYQSHFEQMFSLSKKAKKPYTPVVTRYNRVSATMWFLHHYPKMPLPKLIKFVGVARSIAESIKNKTYKNVYNLSHQDPVTLNLCTVEEFNAFCEENKAYKLHTEGN